MSWQLILIALFGLAFGSFANVIIFRYERKNARLVDRSRCPDCKKTLAWWEMVPVVSWLVQRARCTNCKQPISAQYPLVEATTAAAWLFAFIPYPESAAATAVAALTAAILSTLIVLLVIDLKTMMLPDIYVIYLGVFVFIKLWLQPNLLTASSFLGILVGAGFLLLLWLITRGQGIGFGDVKLMIPLGALFAVSGTITLLFVAFVAGGVVAAYLLLSKKATMKTAVPFGPYLIAAAVLLIAWPTLPDIFFSLLLS